MPNLFFSWHSWEEELQLGWHAALRTQSMISFGWKTHLKKKNSKSKSLLTTQGDLLDISPTPTPAPPQLYLRSRTSWDNGFYHRHLIKLYRKF